MFTPEFISDYMPVIGRAVLWLSVMLSWFGCLASHPELQGKNGQPWAARFQTRK